MQLILYIGIKLNDFPPLFEISLFYIFAKHRECRAYHTFLALFLAV